MILSIAVDATGIFLMRQSFLKVPDSLEEAARIDSAGPFRIYWSVVLPMVCPELITLTTLSFQGSWNEFSSFLVATSSPDQFTRTTGLAQLTSEALGQGNQFPGFMGAALITTIPVAVLSFVFQRRFTGNQLSGGIKG